MLVALDCAMLETLNDAFGLLHSLRQSDSLFHRILLANLINRSALVVRSLDIDHLVNVPLDVVRSNVNLGERNLSLVESHSRLSRGISHQTDLRLRSVSRLTLFSIWRMLAHGVLILS